MEVEWRIEQGGIIRGPSKKKRDVFVFGLEPCTVSVNSDSRKTRVVNDLMHILTGEIYPSVLYTIYSRTQSKLEDSRNTRTTLNMVTA